MKVIIDNVDTFCGFCNTHETEFEENEFLFARYNQVSITEEIFKGESSERKLCDSNHDVFDED